MLLQAEPGHHQFPTGRNYITGCGTAEVAELTRVLRASGSTMNLSQPHLNYPMLGGGGAGAGGGFSISGINLNLGGGPDATATAEAEQALRRLMPPLYPNSAGTNHASGGSTTLMPSFGLGSEAGYGVDMNNNASGAAGRSLMNMEHCLDLDNYWSPY